MITDPARAAAASEAAAAPALSPGAEAEALACATAEHLEHWTSRLKAYAVMLSLLTPRQAERPG